MSQFDNGNPSIHWQVPELPSDELIIPTRIAFETIEGRDLRQGRFPGIVETNTTSNGCYNSDKSKSSVPLTIKYQTESSLQRLKVREIVDGLLKETNGLQDTQFQIKEGVDWRRLCKFQEVATFTVMSVRHLNEQERVALATELMAYRIKYFFLSKAQIVLQLEGIDVEVLRNLLHCSTTTYLPFGQRQQSTQVMLSKIKHVKANAYQMEVKYAPIGSMPLLPLQVLMSSIAAYVSDDENIANTIIGASLISTFSATRFEFQTIVDDDNANISVLTFWVPCDSRTTFPCDHAIVYRNGKKISFTIEHCGNILPQTGAPGEPPRHETKQEHWRKVGEKLNPSFKNRLTVIAPASCLSSSQKRRYGMLREAQTEYANLPVSYTYAEEVYPWILFLDYLPEVDAFDAFLSHFGQYEVVDTGRGAFLRKRHVPADYISKRRRIMLFQLVSGKQCQMNRVEGLESAPYLTKVAALNILPFKDCQVMMFVPPLIDYRLLLTSDSVLKVERIWVFEPYSANTNSSTKATNPAQSVHLSPPSKDVHHKAQVKLAHLQSAQSNVNRNEAPTPTYTPPVSTPLLPLVLTVFIRVNIPLTPMWSTSNQTLRYLKSTLMMLL